MPSCFVETFADEYKGLREIRKHVAWYFKGYPVGGELRVKMATVPDLATFRELLGQLDHSIGYPGAAVEGFARPGREPEEAASARWVAKFSYSGGC